MNWWEDPAVEGERISPGQGKETISESSLKIFFRCPYAYYLKEYVGLSKVPLNGSAAQALFFAQARRKLFNLKDPATGRIFPEQSRAGPELKTAEEMTAEELKNYLASSSPEKFGRALFGKWLALTQEEIYAGRHLVWNFKEQPFIGAKELESAGKNYYQFVQQQGAPILGFMDKVVSFSFEGNFFAVKLPELRKGMIIDDPTIWSFNAEFSGDKASKLENSALVTLRVLAYCLLAHQYPFYRQKWGIEERVAEGWGGKNVYIDEKVKYRQINLTKNLSLETTRRDKDLDTLRKVVEKFLEQTAQERFSPNWHHCPSCTYNAVGRNGEVICHQRKKGERPAVPSDYFRKKSFTIRTKEEENGFLLEGIIQKKEPLEKLVARYRLALVEAGGKVRADSHYSSEIRGWGFEERMLEVMDRELQERTNRLGKDFLHTIDLAQDFQFAGQRKAAEKLLELGYKNGEKEYKPS